MNARGLQASNYGDEENTVIVKPIPIMETQYLQEIFSEAFKDGNFNSGKEFQYSSCVIDLDPEREALGIPDGKFPMTFTGDLSVNSGNQYKTSKIVLQRIDSVSGDKHDTFVMGSHSSDYDKVDDRSKTKYATKDAIFD